MKYLKYTYIDSKTEVSVMDAPAINGPMPPAVEGLEFSFAFESQYPTEIPMFFGTCPSSSDTNVPGVLAELNVADWIQQRTAEMDTRKQRSATLIDSERDRRINEGFKHEGVHYQSRLPQDGKPGDWEVFSGKALEALIAVLNGSQPGDLRWADPTEDFSWIAADNSRVPMDAQMVIELAKAASTHRSRHTFAGSDLKAMHPIPTNVTDDEWWP